MTVFWGEATFSLFVSGYECDSHGRAKVVLTAVYGDAALLRPPYSRTDLYCTSTHVMSYLPS